MIEPFLYLQKIYSLSDKDVDFLKRRFIENRIFENELFMGQFLDETPTMVIGGPCIRKDIEGVSLNTFYQIFMPLKVASILNLPCKIFLGMREEILLQPKYFLKYEHIKKIIIKGIKKIAEDLNTVVEIIDTSFLIYDKLINECIEKLQIKLSIKESTNLFNLSVEKDKKILHSDLRILVDERVIAYNTSYFLNKSFGPNKFLVVEDIEQYKCILYAKKFSKGELPNFLAMIPLPDISGTKCMFRAEKTERIILNQKGNYNILLKQSPSWVLDIYNEILSLALTIKQTKIKNINLAIKQISIFFE
ncbi:MAG: hypothetical protein PHI53_03795 [Candidatus Pacebacteria bacterium]|nr:hypothetical protein [Candidatus Paceibacterota bacterium]